MIKPCVDIFGCVAFEPLMIELCYVIFDENSSLITEPFKVDFL
jgi:hypothetical protein